MTLSLVGAMAAPNLFAQSVTMLDSAPLSPAAGSNGEDPGNTGQIYSYGDGGEFRAIGNSSLNSIINWGAYAASTSGQTPATGISAANDGMSWGYSSSMNNQKYFQTFCIETTVEYTPGNSYNATVSPLVQPGGASITLGTAWLYANFANGNLAAAANGGYNYAYGNSRADSAELLQQAIWYFQAQGSSWYGAQPNAFAQAAENALGGVTAAFSASNGYDGVEALDLTVPGAGGYAQDQLVITGIPEPTAILAACLLLALPMGASTMRVLRRKA